MTSAKRKKKEKEKKKHEKRKLLKRKYEGVRYDQWKILLMENTKKNPVSQKNDVELTCDYQDSYIYHYARGTADSYDS